GPGVGLEKRARRPFLNDERHLFHRRDQRLHEVMDPRKVLVARRCRQHLCAADGRDHVDEVAALQDADAERDKTVHVGLLLDRLNQLCHSANRTAADEIVGAAGMCGLAMRRQDVALEGMPARDRHTQARWLRYKRVSMASRLRLDDAARPWATLLLVGHKQ